jgi:threonine synthase
MQYYSLNNASPRVGFKEATIKGQAPDKGLYFPERIPALPEGLIKDIESYSPEEIALAVIKPYVGDAIPAGELERIVAETINFDFPLIPLIAASGSAIQDAGSGSQDANSGSQDAGSGSQNADSGSGDPDIFSLELFHGPTLAFKDVGARFMSRCLGHFVRGSDQPVTVLVATSGDTGGAVASGFHGVEGVNVVILYPSEKVSSVQELQLTTLGKNISALEVNGSFDDCQHMVKQAFADTGLNKELFLTSANSINVARWLPQQFYYFFAYRQWADKEHPPVISVPSGNFGNICAGLLAHRSGLPVRHFIAACNANDTVPAYLSSGQYKVRPAIATLSNAMDVGNPSNFVRILELFHKEFQSLSKVLTSYSITDEATRKALRDIYTKYHYLADPHGAVGYLALTRWLAEQNDRARTSPRQTQPPHAGAKQFAQKGIFLETAHPVKFYDVVEPILGQKISMPPAVQALLGRKKQSKRIGVDFNELKDFLLGTK